MYQRYAVYYLPPKDSELAEFGAKWFGYDISTGKVVERLSPDGFDLEGLSEIARRYGFHATLKAPFILKKKYDLDELMRRVEKQAGKSTSFTFPAMKVSNLAGFLAVLPKEHRAGVVRLEERLVTKLNKLGKRSKEHAKEHERDERRRVHLNALERSYQQEYGYPYVLDHFRFHMTLLDKADKSVRSDVAQYLEENFRDLLCGPLSMNEVALVGEREDGFFEEIQRFALAPKGEPS